MNPFQTTMDCLQGVTTVQNPDIMMRVLGFPTDKLVSTLNERQC